MPPKKSDQPKTKPVRRGSKYMMLLLHSRLVLRPVLTGMMLPRVIYQDQGNKARAQVQSLLSSLFF